MTQMLWWVRRLTTHCMSLKIAWPDLCAVLQRTSAVNGSSRRNVFSYFASATARTGFWRWSYSASGPIRVSNTHLSASPSVIFTSEELRLLARAAREAGRAASGCCLCCTRCNCCCASSSCPPDLSIERRALRPSSSASAATATKAQRVCRPRFCASSNGAARAASCCPHNRAVSCCPCSELCRAAGRQGLWCERQERRRTCRVVDLVDGNTEPGCHHPQGFVVDVRVLGLDTPPRVCIRVLMAKPLLNWRALLRVGEGLVEVDRSVDCSREWCPSTDVNGHTGGAGVAGSILKVAHMRSRGSCCRTPPRSARPSPRCAPGSHRTSCGRAGRASRDATTALLCVGGIVGDS